MGIAKRGLENEPGLSHIIRVFEAAEDYFNQRGRGKSTISTAETINLMKIEASNERTEAERKKAAAINRLASAVEKIGTNRTDLSMEVMASVINLMRDDSGNSVRALDARLNAHHGLTSPANSSAGKTDDDNNGSCNTYVGRHFKKTTPALKELGSTTLSLPDDSEAGLFPPLPTEP